MTREMMVTEIIGRFGFEDEHTISFCETVEIYENYSGFLADLMLKTLFESMMAEVLEED